MEAVGLDPKQVFTWTSDAALTYFFPVYGGVLSINSLYESGKTSDSKIVEIFKACNWDFSQHNADIVINAMRNNQQSFQSLLQSGGIRHACNNTHLWLGGS